MNTIGIIYNNEITDARYLMFDNSYLTSVLCDFNSLKDGESMFSKCTALNEVTSQFPVLENGTCMFSECSSLDNFTQNLSSLSNGMLMFKDTYLKTFSSNFDSLVQAEGMFYNCDALHTVTIVTENLNGEKRNLIDGDFMFYKCSNLSKLEEFGDYKLEYVKKDLFESLESGHNMFAHTDLRTFDFLLPSLSNGYEMFYNCTSLESVMFRHNNYSFEDDKIEIGTRMFYNCPNLSDINGMVALDGMYINCPFMKLKEGQEMFSETKIKSFYSEMPNLINARFMFSGCRELEVFTTANIQSIKNLQMADGMFMGCVLNKESVVRVVDCLSQTNITSDALITIGADAALKDDEDLFTLLSLNEDKTAGVVASKNSGRWNVTMEWNTK